MTSSTSPPSQAVESLAGPALHFLLRFADSLRGVDTLAEHRRLADQFGSVWWGKFGVGASAFVVDRALRQIRSGSRTLVFLWTALRVPFRADLLNIVGGGTRAAYPAPSFKRVPSYYRRDTCSLWFELSEFTKTSAAEIRDLRLINDPANRPQLTSMRGLIYVSLRWEKPHQRSGTNSTLNDSSTLARFPGKRLRPLRSPRGESGTRRE
jgi:hypothetical protein